MDHATADRDNTGRPRPSAAVAQPTVARLANLQRTLGNAGVGAMLQRHADGSEDVQALVQRDGDHDDEKPVQTLTGRGSAS